MEPVMKKYHYGIVIFIILFLIARIIFLINDTIYLPKGDNDPTYVRLYALGNFFAIIAAFPLMFVVEKYVFSKFHFVPSITILTCSMMVIIYPGPGDTSFIIFYAIISALMSATLPFIYLYVAIKASEETRVKSTLLGLGLIIFFIAVLFYTDILQRSLPILAYLSPILMIIGVFLFQYGLLIYSKSD